MPEKLDPDYSASSFLERDPSGPSDGASDGARERQRRENDHARRIFEAFGGLERENEQLRQLWTTLHLLSPSSTTNKKFEPSPEKDADGYTMCPHCFPPTIPREKAKPKPENPNKLGRRIKD